MKIITLALAAASLLASGAIASADDFGNPFSKHCYGDGDKMKCESGMGRERRLKKDYEVSVKPELVKRGYPSEIHVKTPEDYKRAKAGWNIRGKCETLAENAVTRDKRVNDAKVMYCIVHRAGRWAPKPKIIRDY